MTGVSPKYAAQAPVKSMLARLNPPASCSMAKLTVLFACRAAGVLLAANAFANADCAAVAGCELAVVPLAGAEESVGGAEHCHEARRSGGHERDRRRCPSPPAPRQRKADRRLRRLGFPQPSRQVLNLLRPCGAGRADGNVHLEGVELVLL